MEWERPLTIQLEAVTHEIFLWMLPIELDCGKIEAIVTRWFLSSKELSQIYENCSTV